MKKRLLFLIALSFVVTSNLFAQGVSFSKPEKNLFEIENIAEVSASHKTIAVLPFRALIIYQFPEKRAESQLEQVKNQQKLSYMWQVALYERFTKKSKKLNVEIQDIKETNEILLAHDYIKNYKIYSPMDLCRILNVDAVVFSTYDLALNNDESTLLGSGLSALGSAALDATNLNSQLIKELTSSPGGFIDKLKSGSFTELISMTAGAMGFDPKLATMVASNTGTIVKLAQGETDNLLQDILVNNAELIGGQIGGDSGNMVANLIKKNATTLQNIIDGDVENLFTELVANNLSAAAEQFGGADGAIVSKVISNNSSLIKNVVNGDTSNLFQQILANNASLIGEKIGGSNAQLYTNLIVNNKSLISDISSGNTSGLLQNLIANNMSTLGEQMGSGEVSKYIGLISENKELVQGLMQGDISEIKSKLIEQGSQLVGAKLSNIEIGEFTSILTGNKDLVQSFLSGDTSGIVNQALSQTPGLLGVNLDVSQIQQFSNLVGSNKDIVGNLASGNINGILGGTLSKISSGKLSPEQSSGLGNLLTANPGLLGIVAGGNNADLSTKLQKLNPSMGSTEIAQYTDFLTSNKSEITSLFEVNIAEVDKAKNFMNPEMIAGLSKSYGTDQNFIGGMLSGEKNIMVDQILRSDELRGLGLDSGMVGEIAGLFLNSRDDAAEILASGAIDYYELTGDLSESNFSIGVEEEGKGKSKKKEKLVIKKKKFFNKVTDTYLHGFAGGKSNTSERIGNFFSGSKGDISKTSFSLFDGTSGGLTWNFVDVEENTNVYNMEKSLDKFAKKFYKKLPYHK